MEHRVTEAQLQILIDYLESHRILLKGVSLGYRSREKVDRLWEELAMRLNSQSTGASKTPLRWKKYWADLKCKVKTKARGKDVSGADGQMVDMNPIEQKILCLLGKDAIHNDKEHTMPLMIVHDECPKPEMITDCEGNDPVEGSNEFIEFPKSLIMDFEERRICAEEKLAEAALISARAAETQARAAESQARAAEIQAESSRLQSQALLELMTSLRNN